ncbi:MAG: hypothetical protein WCD57_09535 [Acidobacteriaceae bacterium]
MKTFILWIVFLSSAVLHAEKCTQSGQSLASGGWPRQLRTLCLTESIKINLFRSPDHRKVIEADIDGFRLIIDGKNALWPDGEEFLANNAEVSWSPTSSAFFINYGDGSGLDGWTINVFTIQGNRVVDHKEINDRIVRLFREHIDCSKESVDPNVRGLGWSRDGTHLFAFAQTTVSEPCGTQGEFRGAVASLADRSISKFYSQAEAKQHFHDLLPYNMR